MVGANAFRRERERSGDAPVRVPRRSNFYAWLTGFMVVVTAVMGVLLGVGIVWLEIVVAALFIVFWVAQTIERARAPVTVQAPAS